MKKGFEFTLLVAGESGLGKSTLINSMFLTGMFYHVTLETGGGGGSKKVRVSEYSFKALIFFVEIEIKVSIKY